MTRLEAARERLAAGKKGWKGWKGRTSGKGEAAYVMPRQDRVRGGWEGVAEGANLLSYSTYLPGQVVMVILWSAAVKATVQVRPSSHARTKLQDQQAASSKQRFQQPRQLSKLLQATYATASIPHASPSINAHLPPLCWPHYISPCLYSTTHCKCITTDPSASTSLLILLTWHPPARPPQVLSELPCTSLTPSP